MSIVKKSTKNPSSPELENNKNIKNVFQMHIDNLLATTYTWL